MAKITITIEDAPNGMVKTLATPPLSKLLTALAGGHELTAAEGYAAFVLNKLREESKNRSSKKLNILLPRAFTHD